METMKLLEIHKKGVNAHNKVVSYYGLDYNTKKVLFDRASHTTAKVG